ncbi:hypothetical protein VLK31_20830 [Variovorax sp. H27-G14]|uniref:hypothetical protein n=1 Tax=Variovorax sp. H27-G14 TaxID=3111914 RepID=UPI0038FCEF5E
MLTLERLAREVVVCWERGDLAAAVRALDQRLQEIADDRLKHQDLIERAIGLYADDDIEIDAEDTFISASAEGAFVMGWLWMPSDAVSPTDETPERRPEDAMQPV